MIDTKELIIISKKAGNAIMEIYKSTEFSSVVNFKADDSPLTLADQASHDVIMEDLSILTPDIPIISEEGEEIPYGVRKDYNQYWLIDPLDGTKEFINRNGEFTVNIALIENNVPTQGFIYVPVTEVMYYTENKKSYKEVSSGNVSQLMINNFSNNRIAVRSKSHPSPEEEIVLNRYDVVDSISVGSSLKFCMIAEGKADIYYRHGPTMEWDTAAGQAILQAAGGKVLQNTSNEVFAYNKESLLNGSFLCLGF